ncbi:hypothetical protein K0M31_007180 [Melipona bicolor]|uniref:Uncharacterized protein n=1 Tax=Melipona bicolor TaxID=60889 RepID=A0AA40FSI2_9HYME|nr:hypothetical protein K0M31_007180 [Melipona bicolor]
MDCLTVSILTNTGQMNFKSSDVRTFAKGYHKLSKLSRAKLQLDVDFLVLFIVRNDGISLQLKSAR